MPLPNADGNCPAAATARVLTAQQIIKRRRAARLSQERLAALAGIATNTLSRIETATVTPEIYTMKRIADALAKAERQRKA